MNRLPLALLGTLLLLGCPDGDNNGVDAGTDAGDQDASTEVDAGPTTCDVEAQDCPGTQICIQVLDAGQLSPVCRDGCGLVAQECPLGEKCTWATVDGGPIARTCRPAGGSSGENESCTAFEGGEDSCAPGLVCLLEDASATQNTCRRYCNADADCAGEQRCQEQSSFPPGTDERPRLCVDPPSGCDPFAPACASPSEGCYPAADGGICVTAGDAEPGAPCSFSNDCAPGNTCISRADAGTCAALCRFPVDAGPPACAAGTCTPLSNATVGVCVP